MTTKIRKATAASDGLRGPIPYDNTVSNATFDPPIAWIHIAAVGSGGLVVKDEGGTTRTYTSAHLATGVTIFGPFSAITSTTCTALLAGDGPAPRAIPSSTVLGSTAAGQGASAVGIADAGSFTAQTTVEGALQEIYQDLESAQRIVPIPLAGAILAAGTPMAAFANNASSNPGITLDNSKAVGLRWNNNASQTAVWFNIIKPLDMDVTKGATFVVLASKSGATVGDATTFDVGCYEQTPGALEDAGSNLGGTTGALTGNATAKTVSRLTLAIAGSTFAAPPGSLSVSLKPTDGTLGTDDAVCNGFYLVYQRKLLTS